MDKIPFGGADHIIEIAPIDEVGKLLNLLKDIKQNHFKKCYMLFVSNEKLALDLDTLRRKNKTMDVYIPKNQMRELVELYRELHASNNVTIGYTEYKSYKPITP